MCRRHGSTPRPPRPRPGGEQRPEACSSTHQEYGTTGLFEQKASDLPAARLWGARDGAMSQHDVAVERGEQALDLELSRRNGRRIRTSGQIAITTQLAQERSLGVDSAATGAVLDTAQQLDRRAVIATTLD